MRVLGIDPGSKATGYGVIEGHRALAFGVIRPRDKDLATRLLRIYQGLSELIKRYSPEVIALEEVLPESFPHAALKLGQAQGVALLVAAQNELPVFLYHPLEIKKAFTGYGNASKDQLCFVIKKIFQLEEDLPRDASDALSVALYHLQVAKIQAKLG